MHHPRHDLDDVTRQVRRSRAQRHHLRVSPRITPHIAVARLGERCHAGKGQVGDGAEKVDVAADRVVADASDLLERGVVNRPRIIDAAKRLVARLVDAREAEVDELGLARRRYDDV